MVWLWMCFGLAEPIQEEELTQWNERWYVVKIHPQKVHFRVIGRTKEERKISQAWKRLQSGGKQPLIMMNGGMYHIDHKPVGMFIDEKGIWNELNTKKGNGNFFLLPNGVFGVDQEGAPFVVQTSQYKRKNVQMATQSGPMLVVNNEIHSAFREDSPHEKIRNGVGVNTKGEVFFVVSQTPVRFYDFARLMKDTLGCPNALYLDGTVSSIKTQKTTLGQTAKELGPILVVESLK